MPNRPSRARITATILVLAVAVPVWVACSNTSSTNEAVELCQDLLHLHATVELLADPPSGLRVGEIREALEKLGPTSNNLGDPVVTDRLQAELFRAEDGYRAAIDGVGDDETIMSARIDVAGLGRRLDAAYQAVLVSLHCALVAEAPA